MRRAPGGLCGGNEVRIVGLITNQGDTEAAGYTGQRLEVEDTAGYTGGLIQSWTHC